MVERERLSNTYIDMLVWLAAHYKEPDQLQESIRICYRILEKDRAHENGHLLLTEAYALLGYYGLALHQHSLYQRALKSTHGTEPSVETVKRFEKVLARSIHGRSSGLGFARGKTDEYPAKAANTSTLIPTAQDHVGSRTPTSCRATRRGPHEQRATRHQPRGLLLRVRGPPTQLDQLLRPSRRILVPPRHF